MSLRTPMAVTAAAVVAALLPVTANRRQPYTNRVSVRCSTTPRWQVTKWVVWSDLYASYPGDAVLKERTRSRMRPGHHLVVSDGGQLGRGRHAVVVLSEGHLAQVRYARYEAIYPQVWVATSLTGVGFGESLTLPYGGADQTGRCPRAATAADRGHAVLSE